MRLLVHLLLLCSCLAHTHTHTVRGMAGWGEQEYSYLCVCVLLLLLCVYFFNLWGFWSGTLDCLSLQGSSTRSTTAEQQQQCTRQHNRYCSRRLIPSDGNDFQRRVAGRCSRDLLLNDRFYWGMETCKGTTTTMWWESKAAKRKYQSNFPIMNWMGGIGKAMRCDESGRHSSSSSL